MTQNEIDEKLKVARLTLARVERMLDLLEWRAGKQLVPGGVGALEEATTSLALAADCIKEVVPE